MVNLITGLVQDWRRLGSGDTVMRALRTFVVAALMAMTSWTFSHSAERVDLLLLLAGSMDEPKFELQRSGYAAAFSDPRVTEAICASARGGGLAHR